MAERARRFRVLQTGDLHVGRGRASWGEAIALDRAAKLFDALYRVAREQRCHAVCICGDVFDSKHVTNAERELVVKALTKYAGADGIQTYVIPGNHDQTSARGSNLEFLAVIAASGELPKLHVSFSTAASVWMTEAGIGIVGAPVNVSEHQSAVESTVETLDKATQFLFLGHGTVGGALRNDANWRPTEAEDAKRLSLRRAAEMAPNVVGWLYGDIHKRQSLPTLPIGSHGWYAGSPIQMDFGEQPGRGVLVVAFDRESKEGWRYVGKRYIQIDGPGSGFQPLVTAATEDDIEAAPSGALLRLAGTLVLSAERRDAIVKKRHVVQDHSTPEAVLTQLAGVSPGASALGRLEVFDPLLADRAELEQQVLGDLPPDAAIREEAKHVVTLAVERFRARTFLS